MTFKAEQHAAQDDFNLDKEVSEASIDTESCMRSVLRRKTETDDFSVDANPTSARNPAEQAASIGAAWRGGIGAVVDAGVLMMESLIAFRNDPKRLDAFITGLVGVGLLTTKEARRRVGSPKVTKLNAIGEHADLLRHKEIAPFLGPSYSTLYQLVVLFGQTEGEYEQRVKRLIGILRNCPSEITREYLGEQTDRLKRSRKNTPTKKTQKGFGETYTTGIEDAVQAKPSDLIDARLETDLAVLTPSEQDRMVLSRDYADDSALERSLPLLERLQHNDDLALLISVRESDFPVIADRLLRLCGFRRATKVLLAHNPVSWDITDAEIIVIAERGGMRLALPADAGWVGGTGIPILSVADLLYPGAKIKLHVFASAPTEGWTSLVGTDCWAEEPSI